MGKRLFALGLARLVGLVVGLVVGSTVAVAPAAELSATEQRWLQGAWPVISYAKASGLPLDVVVQPQPTPGAAPLALAFVEGRCKLVLSMRANPEAEATLARIEPDLLDATLELMAAHELGHCRRYLDGAWTTLPAGFVAARAPARLDPTLHTAFAQMQATRREEGFGDLVGLAWIQQRRPALYVRMHAWLLAERTHSNEPGSHHDTLAWLRLAEPGMPLGEDGSIFASASRLWPRGLAVDE